MSEKAKTLSVTKNLKETNARIKQIVEKKLREAELKFIQHLEKWEKLDKLIQKMLQNDKLWQNTNNAQ